MKNIMDYHLNAPKYFEFGGDQWLDGGGTEDFLKGLGTGLHGG